MERIFNNKWALGNSFFNNHDVPEIYKDFNGIYTIYAALDKSIGSEVILYIRDETDFIYDLANLKPFNLALKSGIVKTNFGPLLFLLFYLPDPKFNNRPYVMYDMHLDPFSMEHLSKFYDLSRQSHWHLFLINKKNEQIEFFEFENVFGLYERLKIAEEACEGKKSIDFWKAKEEFMNKYSLEELYLM